MAPSKFGLFKARSKDQSDQPSIENLLQSSNSIDSASLPPPNMSPEELALADMAAQMCLDSHNVEIEKYSIPVRRASESGKQDSVQIGYKQLKNQLSTEMTSTSTLQDDDLDQILHDDQDQLTTTRPIGQVDDDASTSCDANSIQFDDLSIAPSEDLSVYCGGLKKPKKSRSKEEEQIIKDCDMWHASNIEVMQNLLNKSGTLDDQIKWQAIATARGLCTLTDNCTCGDCRHAKFLAGMADGDGGLASAPLFNAVSVGCTLQ